MEVPGERTDNYLTEVLSFEDGNVKIPVWDMHEAPLVFLQWRGSRQSKWKHRADRWTGRTRFEGILGLISIQTVGGGTGIGPLGVVIVQIYDSAWDKGI